MSLILTPALNQAVLNNNGNDSLVFKDNAGLSTTKSLRTRILRGTDGTLNGPVNVGGLVLPKANIQFPATQAASADANTLDDYEEGTWTPYAGIAPGVISVSQANYRKVGNLVYINTLFTFADQPSLTGTQAVVYGIPFPLRAGTIGALSIGYNSTQANAAGNDPYGRTWQYVSHAMVYGGDQITLYNSGNVAYHGNCANAQLYLSGHYLTN